MKTFFLNTLRSPLANLGRRLARDKNIAQLRRKDRSLVWHVAMPKSGSTWVSSVVGNGLVASRGWRKLKLVPEYGQREQEVDPRQLLERNALDDHIFAVHQHCPYSNYALDFIRSFGVRVLLQVRSIPDCLVSVNDHLNNESVEIPMAFMSDADWSRLPDEKKLHFLVDLVAPWYIRFWAGWSTLLAATDIDCHLVKYEDLITQPDASFRDVARFCDATMEDADVAAWIESSRSVSTRKNTGTRGRGSSLPGEAHPFLARLAAYYPSVDFDMVGIPSSSGTIQTHS